jgi:hypothetical protein
MQALLAELNLPKSTLKILAERPEAGQGVNRWLLSFAMSLHHSGRREDEIAQLLAIASGGCGREVTDTEIRRAISTGKLMMGKPGRNAQAQPPKWPKANEERIEAIVKEGPKLAGLIKLSPRQWSHNNPHTEEVIEVLFPGNPLLCAGLTKFEFDTLPREAWRGRLARRQFIVPSPMSRVYGVTSEGKESKHSLDNTGPRRFLVIEFDPKKFEQLSEAEQTQFGCEANYYDAKRDEHAALLLHLLRFLPLVLVVHSAGKSLHGWFDCSGRSDSDLHRFMRYAASLGADPATWTRSQFARMPDGMRDNRKRQKVLFFDPGG